MPSVSAKHRRLPSGQALQRAAGQVYQYLFSEALPPYVRVVWKWGLGNAAGQATIGALYEGGRVDLDFPYASRVSDPLAILVHEFAHVRGWQRHDARFAHRVNQWLDQLGLPRERKGNNGTHGGTRE